jgi:hypothetical protein
MYDVIVALGSTSGVLPGGFTVTTLGAFSVPTVVTALASTSLDDDPTMTGDGLELYFNSTRPGGSGGGDIWVSMRASVTDPWQAPVPVTSVNDTGSETTPGVTADGLELYIGSNRAGGLGGTDIYVSTRTTRSDAWSTPVRVTELSTASAEHGVQPSASGLAIVFNSDRNGTTQLFIATRASRTAPWGAPVQMSELASGDEADASLAADERAIVFQSGMRPGNLGGSDLHLAQRVSATVAFEQPVPLIELNSAANDSDGWLSEDLRYILFTSDRDGTSQIYEASR